MSIDEFLKLLDERRIVRRLILLWWVVISTIVLIWAMRRSNLTPEVVDLVEIVFSVAGVIFGLYTAGRTFHETRRFWRRGRDHESDPESPDDRVG